MPESGPLVLDTHVWIWAVGGVEGELSPRALEALEAASGDGRILIPAISVWEVGMLDARGRIVLSRPVDDWVAAALRAPGASLLPLTPEIAVESARLPGAPPGDPADRMIIASARVAGGRVVTRDRGILEYGRRGHVGVVDAAG